jgi:hypothetical protein
VSDVNIDKIVAELQHQVSRRRVAGDYPEGLEQQLESEFHGMMSAVDRHEIDTALLGGYVDGVRRAIYDIDVSTDTRSRVPGGAAAHETMGRVIVRHTYPIAASLRDLGVCVTNALSETRRLFEAQSSADERQLLDALAGVLDRLALLDHLVEITRDLEQRVAVLESEQEIR